MMVPIKNAIADYLAELEIEVFEEIDLTGGTHGPIRPKQKPWSDLLDVIEAERQGVVR